MTDFNAVLKAYRDFTGAFEEFLKDLGGEPGDTEQPPDGIAKEPDLQEGQAVPVAKDEFWYFRPLLNLIGKSEGTDKGRGYNETLAYGLLTGGDVNLVNMTLEEVLVLQEKMLASKKNRWNSSALGRYQIVRKTLLALISKMKVSRKAYFDQNMQDAMAVQLLIGRGIGRWLNGSITTEALMAGLAAEWASLPKINGQGAYHPVKITPTEVQAVLGQVKTLWGQYKASQK